MAARQAPELLKTELVVNETGLIYIEVNIISLCDTPERSLGSNTTPCLLEIMAMCITTKSTGKVFPFAQVKEQGESKNQQIQKTFTDSKMTEEKGKGKVLIKTLDYSPWTFESEKIASVEIIYKEVKKKANESSGGVSDEDDSYDSDSDAISNHDYARREIISRVPHSSDMPNVFVQCPTNSICDDSSSQASENPDTDPEDFEEREMDIVEDYNDTSSDLLNPFSEVNCNYFPRRRNSACFTINLKTVQLGTSEEDMDSSAGLLSSQEDVVDWQCTRAVESKLLDDTESVQKPHCHNGSHEWQNSSGSSDESDSSDSDTDQKTEYIRR
ncbi:PREDICTED: dentin sialophosphoprotein-like [Tauraco erythrolophus]|uniref:dentin sialophosphoprotein-like n=1 Tax=Tauraco erythrolophus TaxID=121530 RepID=UPI00052356E1|nr:PREDICTED: dentin sialophosphoprotein-like [Tauraco erythrolophus]